MKKLTLIGAGPGDPELFTLKGIKALQKADIVLYDALASEELLDYAYNAKEKVFVGKRFGCHALSQNEINQLILEYSDTYDHIVRLKGGDPFVFGRAQEEIETAKKAGMQIEVVPGISSALAVPASQLIPMTARGTNQSFWVVTGTTCKGDISGDLHLAAQSDATVVILMAMNKLEEITKIFTRFGKAKTPVAIIQNGTLKNEKIVRGSIDNIYVRAMHEKMSNPAVIVIGNVVPLNETVTNKININEEAYMDYTTILKAAI